MNPDLSEMAQRAIFFAQYEASQFGSPLIETEHLLLGVHRRALGKVPLIVPAPTATLRELIQRQVARREKIPSGVEIPLSEGSIKVLNYAHEEAHNAGQCQVGPEFILLGLLREKDGLANKILTELKILLEPARAQLRKSLEEQGPTGVPAFPEAFDMLETLKILGHLQQSFTKDSAEFKAMDAAIRGLLVSNEERLIERCKILLRSRNMTLTKEQEERLTLKMEEFWNEMGNAFDWLK